MCHGTVAAAGGARGLHLAAIFTPPAETELNFISRERKMRMQKPLGPLIPLTATMEEPSLTELHLALYMEICQGAMRELQVTR